MAVFRLENGAQVGGGSLVDVLVEAESCTVTDDQQCLALVEELQAGEGGGGLLIVAL